MRRFLVGLAWTAGLLAVIVGLLRLLVFNVWTVPDDPVLAASIAPSLDAGDVVLTLKIGERGFGELVRCPDPEDSKRFVVGRIVGLEGDDIAVDDGYLEVNGTKYISADACPTPTISIVDPRTGQDVALQCSRVELGGGWHYLARYISARRERLEASVPAANFYLLSDNRSYHDDSRDFGAILKKDCTEQIVFRLWGSTGWSDDVRRMTVIH